MTTQTLIGYVKGDPGTTGPAGPTGATGPTGPVGNVATYDVTIATSDWSNKTATKVLSAIAADSNLIVTPTPASMGAVIESKAYCSSQAASSLTFVCEEVPSTGVDFTVAIIG